MKTHPTLVLRTLVLITCLLSPAALLAQSSPSAEIIENYQFSYTIIEGNGTTDQVLETARANILQPAARSGGILYATWSAAQKPDDAPFAGLAANQLGLMLTWPRDADTQLAAYSDLLQSAAGIEVLSHRLFEAIYLPFGLSVPTTDGFYVHRETHYPRENEAEVVRLSEEAWVTWEPRWQVTVVGLFRELGTSGYSNLNRIVWYPSHTHWRATRNNDDEASATRFRQRRALRLPGAETGIAIATDRTLP